MSPIPVSNWNTTTINGDAYLVIDVAQFYVPLDWDPSSNMFIAVAAPSGGLGNFPALVKGDDGDTPELDLPVDLTVLAFDDPTADSAVWTEISTSPLTYRLALTIHAGPQGETGTTTLMLAGDIAGTEGALPNQILVVNATGDGFFFANQRVGDSYTPATIASVPSGNAAYTVAAVPVPAQGFDWRPKPWFQSVISGNGPDVAVDLIVRLSNSNTDGGETTGNEVGRAIGLTGYGVVNQIITPGPPPGSGDGYDRVLAGSPATIFFRTERQSGISTYTTEGTTTRCGVKVEACPTDLAGVQPAPGGGTALGPSTVVFTTAGDFTSTPPYWANWVDVIALGGGGGGGGGIGGVGQDGDDTTVTVDTTTLTGAGGPGAPAGDSTSVGDQGASPGAYTYLGNTYVGGAVVQAKTVGAAPGGGGGGGATVGLYAKGGAAGVFAAQTYPLTIAAGSTDAVTSIAGTVGAGGDPNAFYNAAGGAAGAAWLVYRV